MTGRPTTYHVMTDEDSGELLILVRLYPADSEAVGEVYRSGRGWVSDDIVYDVMRNGQDYDLVDADRANALIAQIEAGGA